MTTDYDPIAEQYTRSKLQPWRTHIESFTLVALLGDLSDSTVVDVACGEGYYTRLLRVRGASKVRGVDLSAHMIESRASPPSAGNSGPGSWIIPRSPSSNA